MSREDFVAVAVRLFVVWLVLSMFQQILYAAPAFIEQGWDSANIAYGLFLLFGLLVGVFLWVFPLTAARKLLPTMSEPRSEQVIGAPVALSLGLTLLGLWLLANALIDGGYWLTVLLLFHRDATGMLSLGHDQIAGMVGTVLELVVGLWLVFGNAGLRRLIFRFRYGETPEEASRQ
jgi:hypothetical protein